MEVIKIVGAAVVSSVTTFLCLWIQRKWKKQDTREERDDAVMKKLNNLAESIETIKNQLEDHIRDDEQYFADSNVRRTALQSGMREVLYDIIKTRSIQYEIEGKIREEDYNSLHRMWSVYHDDLKGNGFLNERMQVIEKLEKY